jgi:hypothetical protein
MRCARGANDGDGGARGEAAGEEDDPAPRALGDRGGALGGVGGVGGGGGEQRPGSPAKAAASSQAVRLSAQASSEDGEETDLQPSVEYSDYSNAS